MLEKEKETKDEEIDLQAFEVRIDQEIDNLFVPAGNQPPATAGSGDLTIGTEDQAGNPLFQMRGESHASACRDEETLADTMMSVEPGELDLHIASEIDSLFVPADFAPVQQEPKSGFEIDSDVRMQKSEPPETEAAVMNRNGESSYGKYIAREASSFIHESREPEKPCEILAGESSGYDGADTEAPGDHRLSSLLESFNIAYLSLDWEFSAENIERLQVSLKELEPYCNHSVAANSVWKILNPVLDRLRIHAKNPDLQWIELLRDAQDLLKTLLTADGAHETWEKETVKGLIRRFQGLKDAPPFRKRRDDDFAIDEMRRAIPMEDDLPLPPPPDAESMIEKQTDGSVGCRWAESHGMVIRECANALEEEEKRLARIEEITGKAEALQPLTARLGAIRSNLSRQISILKAVRDEWCQMQRMETPGSRSDLGMNGSIEPEMESVSWDGGMKSGKDAEGEDAFPAQNARREDVCVFSFAGKRFGVPVSQLVRISSISDRKAGKIVRRGYATLSDFKPFFKSIRSGLFGIWAGLPTEVLKEYRFVPIPFEERDERGLPPVAGGAIMVSSGRRHGILFADTPRFDLQNQAEIFKAGCSCEDALGVIRTGAHDPVKVFDTDKLVKKYGSESGRNDE